MFYRERTMGLDKLSPDELIYWQTEFITLNATIVYTWVVMGLLMVAGWAATFHLSTGRKVSRWQTILETIVGGIRKQIQEVTHQDPDRYIALVGTLFLFIATCNVLSVVPGFHAPTGSLSTTTALALCVFVAVPIYGVAELGWKDYLRQYLQPTPLMLPFNIIGEISRTLALAVRLFGNVMSGAKIIAIFVALAPLFVGVLPMALSLLTGLVQAYIFAVLAMVYIASASAAHRSSASDEYQGETTHG